MPDHTIDYHCLFPISCYDGRIVCRRQHRCGAHWQEDDITTEVTAHLGPRGGLSSPEEGQGLQYRRYSQASDEVQTGIIRVDGMVHTTTLPGGDPETVHDKEASDKIYRDLGGAALALTMPLPGYEQRTLE